MGFLKPKKAKSESGNKNLSLINGIYTPAAQQGVASNNILAGALGVPGGNAAGANAGFANYSKNAGFENILSKLVRGITGGQAAAGLLRSGSTSSRLLEEGTALNQQYYNNYLQNLLGLSNLGLGAGGLLANAGQYGTSTGGGPSTAGAIASTVGGIASIPGVGGFFKSIFSDSRLKTDIEKVGVAEDGLGIYAFRYIGQLRRLVGVMADEVALLRPWALGPTVVGYRTVNYGAL